VLEHQPVEPAIAGGLRRFEQRVLPSPQCDYALVFGKKRKEFAVAPHAALVERCVRRAPGAPQGLHSSAGCAGFPYTNRAAGEEVNLIAQALDRLRLDLGECRESTAYRPLDVEPYLHNLQKTVEALEKKIDIGAAPKPPLDPERVWEKVACGTVRLREAR